jgi:pimeloyl-ACP methyl ester carboxylesterase
MPGIFHIEKGKGRSLVLLHGFCETHQIWNPISEELSQQFHLLIPDLPGFGKSKLTAHSLSVSDVADQIWKWLQDKNVVQPVVVGHSLGGYIALAMAAQHPKKMSGLGLFHSTALDDNPEKKTSRNKVMEFVARNGVGPFIDTFVPGLFYKKDHPALSFVDQICRQTQLETLLAYTSAMRDRPDRQATLIDFDKPVMILAGEKDEIIPLESLKKQASLLKNGQFSILEETAHMGMFEDPNHAIQHISGLMKACI